MQRRAAAMYFAFFVIVGAAAYGVIAASSAPHVSLDGPTYGQNDKVTLEGRTYTVSDISKQSGGGGGGHGGGGGGEATITGKLSWVNESAQLSAKLDNGSTVSPVTVVWEGQQARHEATVDAGATIRHAGGQYTVSINASAPSVTLTNTQNASQNSTFAPGDTLEYRGNEATVASIGSDSVTLVWGDPYRVDIPNVTNMPNVSTPPNVTFVQERNITALVMQDPALYNETVTINGVRYVTYRANDTNVPVVEYFGPVDTKTFQVGDTLRYKGNETTISSITADAVTVTWSGEKTNTVDLEEGGEFTVKGTMYFAHFPNADSVQILPYDKYWNEYQQDKETISAYHQRKAGLWGVAELSFIAAIILLGTAFLPVRG